MSKTIKLIQSSIEALSNNSFITKLYNMLIYYETYHNSTFDMEHTDFVGTLTIPYTYEKYVTKINEYFPRCIINSIDYYICFEDHNVEQALLNAGIGDGTGITLATAAACTSLPSFEGNNNIVSFNELQYFTGLTATPRFTNCSNLVSVRIPTTVKTITDYSFYGCSNLETIGDITNIEYINIHSFGGCSKLIFEGDFINLTGGSLSGVKGFDGGKAVFDGTFTVFSVGGIGATTIEMKGQWQHGMFNGDTRCKVFILPETTTQIIDKNFDYCYDIESVIIKATTPPICGSNLFAHANDANIYVPDESVNAYKAASGWSVYASYIYPISSYQES